MKRTVLVFGLISGLIVSVLMVAGMSMVYNNPDFKGSMVIGYASMILAFSFVFVGIKNYRDKYNGGVITFGTAFKTGIFISLIASTMYVATWMVDYHFFMPDFMDRYSAHVLKEAVDSGATQIEISEKTAEMEKYGEMYKNPLFVIMFTYLEILPVGILVTVISSIILKRKENAGTVEIAG